MKYFIQLENPHSKNPNTVISYYTGKGTIKSYNAFSPLHKEAQPFDTKELAEQVMITLGDGKLSIIDSTQLSAAWRKRREQRKRIALDNALANINELMERGRHGRLGMTTLRYAATKGRNINALADAYDSGKIINLRYVQLGNNKLKITTPEEVYTYSLRDTFSYAVDVVLALMVNQSLITLNKTLASIDKALSKPPQITGVIFDDAANIATSNNGIRTN